MSNFRSYKYIHWWVIFTCVGLIAGCSESNSKQLAPETQSPTYDVATMYVHIRNLLDVEEKERELFVRWEQPIRYYLQGLDNYPGLETALIKQLNRLADLTGLDIQRHDDLYMDIARPALNQKGPDGYYTTVAIFFTDDMAHAFMNDPKVSKVINGFAKDPQAEYALWQAKTDPVEEKEGLTYFRNTFQHDGITFSTSITSLTLEGVGQMSDAEKQRLILSLPLKLITDIGSRSNKIPSFYNKDANQPAKELTSFDQAFLKIYYSDVVHSGMYRRDAALTIAETLDKQLNPPQE